MTRVVQNKKTGKVMVLCKGADTSIMQRSRPRDSKQGTKMKIGFNEEETDLMERIEEFAN